MNQHPEMFSACIIYQFRNSNEAKLFQIYMKGAIL